MFGLSVGGDDTAESSDGDVAECSDLVHKRCHDGLENIDSDDNGYISENEQLKSSGDEQQSLYSDSVSTLQEDLAEFMTSARLTRDACNRLLGLYEFMVTVSCLRTVVHCGKLPGRLK